MSHVYSICTKNTKNGTRLQNVGLYVPYFFRQFIRKEVAAYTSFQNNLSETPFVFTSSRFEGYALTINDAIAYDMAKENRN